MSVTQKEIQIAALKKAMAYGKVAGDVTTITSVIYTPSTELETSKDNMPKTLIIDGKTYNWIVDEYSKPFSFSESEYVKKAHLNIGRTITINKPIVKVVMPDVGTTEFEFSFYDLGYVFTAYLSESEIELDGKTPVEAEVRTENDFLKLSSDAVYKFIWKIGAKTYSEEKRTGGSDTLKASYTMPKSWLEGMTWTDYGYGNVSVEVYFGSTLYCTATGSLRVRAPEDCKPKINAVALADTLGRVPKEWGMFVQSNSNIAISSIDIEESYKSGIKSVELIMGENTFAGTTYALPAMTSAVEDYGVLEITVKVTDYRGRTDEKSAKITVVEYKPPTLQVDSYRCGETGDIENEGLYFLATTNSTYSTCNGKNKATMTAQYKLTSEENYPDSKQELPVGQASTVCGGDLDTEYSYNVLYTISDAFNTIRVIDYVSTAVYAMHFLRGGRGIAFGMKATVENAADFGFNAIFRKGMTYVKEDGTEVTMDQILEALGL